MVNSSLSFLLLFALSLSTLGRAEDAPDKELLPVPDYVYRIDQLETAILEATNGSLPLIFIYTDPGVK